MPSHAATTLDEPVAEMAGGTREKVNRCLRDWQRQGIIELKNRWTIIRKPEALHILFVPFFGRQASLRSIGRNLRITPL
jgi:hypothetical protein